MLLPLVLLVGAGLWIRALRMRALGDMLEQARTTPEWVCESANGPGVESAGMAQA